MVSKKMKSKKSRTTFLDELMKMTKAALYKIAQALGIPGRSVMSKDQLAQVLDEKKKDVTSILSSDELAVHVEKKEEKKTASIKAPAPAITKEPTPIQETTVKPQEAVSSHIGEVKAEEEPAPPSGVWGGEEGPELPQGYGTTVLRALPRDPHWVYVYWEIAEETKARIRAEKGEWIFDVSQAVLRVYNDKNEVSQEIFVLLDALNWYIPLAPNTSFQFELGLKDRDGNYTALVRSEPVTMPPEDVSQETDEEWSVLEEQFEEMLETSGGMDFTRWGGSAGVMHQVLRHKVRVPWSVSLENLPSSHGFVSSHTTRK